MKTKNEWFEVCGVFFNPQAQREKLQRRKEGKITGWQ